MRWILLLPLLLFACNPPSDFCINETDPYDKDYCLLNTGLEQNVSEACDQIANENLQIWCYTDVATNMGDASICNDINKQSTQEHCIKNVGIKLQDTNLCDSIQGTAAGDECFRTIALDTADASLCIQVIITEQRNRCYIDVAEEVSEYTFCTFVVDDDRRRDSCIFRTSLKANATEGCAETILDEFNDVCYFNHAVKLLDKEICSGITTEKVQRSCRAAVKLESTKRQI